MTKNQKLLLGAGVLAVAGVYIWYRYYGPGAAVTVSVPGATTSTLTPIPSAPTTAVAQTAAAVNAGTQAPTTQGSTAAPMSNSLGAVLPSNIYAWIFQHAQPWPSQFFTNVFPTFTPADVANLTNIVNLYFNTNTPVPSGALATWWNNTFGSQGM
jgi:hypothetical protein